MSFCNSYHRFIVVIYFVANLSLLFRHSSSMFAHSTPTPETTKALATAKFCRGSTLPPSRPSSRAPQPIKMIQQPSISSGILSRVRSSLWPMKTRLLAWKARESRLTSPAIAQKTMLTSSLSGWSRRNSKPTFAARSRPSTRMARRATKSAWHRLRKAKRLESPSQLKSSKAQRSASLAEIIQSSYKKYLRSWARLRSLQPTTTSETCWRATLSRSLKEVSMLTKKARVIGLKTRDQWSRPISVWIVKIL